MARVAGDVASHDIHHPAVRDDEDALAPVAGADVFNGFDHAVGKLIHGFAADELSRRVAPQNLFQQRGVEFGQLILGHALHRAKMLFAQTYMRGRRWQMQGTGYDLRGLQRPCQRAGPHGRKVLAGQVFGQSDCLLAPKCVDGHIQPALQDAKPVPVGLSVAGDADVGGVHVNSFAVPACRARYCFAPSASAAARDAASAAVLVSSCVSHPDRWRSPIWHSAVIHSGSSFRQGMQ